MRAPRLKKRTAPISPIPARDSGPISRATSLKRLSRVRINWFVVGSIFGIGVSFFMHFIVSTLVVPGYQQITKRLNDTTQVATAPAVTPVTVAEKTLPPVPVAVAETPAAPALPTVEPIKTADATPAPAPTYPRAVALEVGRGDTLLDLLIANRVLPAEAQNVIKALKPAVNLQTLRVGQKISVTLARHETVGDRAAVRELAIKLPNFDTVELQRKQNGAFSVATAKEAMTPHAYRGFGKPRRTPMFPPPQ